MNKNKEYIKHGSITLLDILGTKNKSAKNDFIFSIDKLYDHLEKIKNKAEEKVPYSNTPDQFFDKNTVRNLKKMLINPTNYKIDNKSAPKYGTYKLEIEVETFSDTILIAIYSEQQKDNDALLMHYTGIILTEFIREMFISSNILLRGAFAFGDYLLKKDKNKSIRLGSPIYEASELYESANWGGVVTTPSATLTLDHLNLVREKENIKKIPKNTGMGVFQEIAEDFLEIYDIFTTYMIKYPVPFKNSMHIDCYSLAWPFFGLESENGIIKKRVEKFLDYRKFQREKINIELYIKYRNTQAFIEFLHKKNETMMESIMKLRSML